MANEQNLVPFTKGCSAASKGGKIGGKKSGETRRKKKEIRENLQTILEGNYEVKGLEDKISGSDYLALTLFKIATDPKHKQCIPAQRLIYELTGMDKSPEEKKKIKQALLMQKKEIELMQKKIDEGEGWTDGV